MKRSVIDDLIDKIVDEDTALVQEARRLALVEDEEEVVKLTPRELALRSAARKGQTHVPWYLAEASANARLRTKLKLDREYLDEAATRLPAMVIVQPVMLVGDWQKKAREIQERNEQERQGKMIEAVVAEPEKKP